MRDYAKISHQCWTGELGRLLRQCALPTRYLALYFLTSPHSNMLRNIRFCEYDFLTKYLWVLEMAKFELGEPLKPQDRKIKGVHNIYSFLPFLPFLNAFFERYRHSFC